MNKYTSEAKAKGWSMKALATRWGIKQRQMSNIAGNPKQRDWDALKGLPDLTEA